MTSVRVDSWVWAVRLAKTRSQATAACRAGHVRVNGAPAKAATPVRIGDEVRTRLHEIERIYKVTGLAVRRGSATEAAKHFEDLTPPPPPRVERPATVYRDPGAGRPTKRDRRQLDKLRGRERSDLFDIDGAFSHGEGYGVGEHDVSEHGASEHGGREHGGREHGASEHGGGEYGTGEYGARNSDWREGGSR